MKILVIDIGGTKVKFRVFGERASASFLSGETLTPRQFVDRTLNAADAWRFDAISIGFPGPVLNGKPVVDPPTLGKGWVRFDFKKAFTKPVQIINDAAMQAIGSYEGGRMLFLGLGTGLGSTLILDKAVVPLELGELPFFNGRNLDEMVGKRGLEKYGKAKWSQFVHSTVEFMQASFRPDYIVLGGGNVDCLKRLPKGTRRGSNKNAIKGGARLWDTGMRASKQSAQQWCIF